MREETFIFWSGFLLEGFSKGFKFHYLNYFFRLLFHSVYYWILRAGRFIPSRSSPILVLEPCSDSINSRHFKTTNNIYKTSIGLVAYRTLSLHIITVSTRNLPHNKHTLKCQISRVKRRPCFPMWKKNKTLKFLHTKDMWE